jgi:hypothetical protein
VSSEGREEDAEFDGMSIMKKVMSGQAAMIARPAK